MQLAKWGNYLCLILGVGTACGYAQAADEIEILAEKVKADIQKSQGRANPDMGARVKSRKIERIEPLDSTLSPATAGLFNGSYYDRQFSNSGLQQRLSTVREIPLFFPGHIRGNNTNALLSNLQTRPDRNRVEGAFLGGRDFEAGLSASTEQDLKAGISGKLLSRRGFYDDPQGLTRESLFASVDVPQRSGGLSTFLIVDRDRGNDPGWIAMRQIEPGVGGRGVGRFSTTDPTGLAKSETYLLASEWSREFSGQQIQVAAYGGHHQTEDFLNRTFFLTDATRGDQRELSDKRWLYGGKLQYQLIEEGRESKLVTSFSVRSDNQSADSIQNLTEARQFVAPLRGDSFSWRKNTFGVKQEIQWLSWVKTDAAIDLVQTTQKGESYDSSAILVAPGLAVALDFDRIFDIQVGTHIEARPRDIRALRSDDRPMTKVVQYDATVGSDLLRKRFRAEMSLFGSVWEDEPLYDGVQNAVLRVPKRSHLGFEWKLKAAPTSWLTLTGSYIVQRSRFNEPLEGGDAVPSVPEQLANFNARLRFSDALSLGWSVRHVGKRTLSSDNFFSQPAFFLSDTALNYDQKGYAIALGVENLFNTAWNEFEAVSVTRLSGENSPAQCPAGTRPKESGGSFQGCEDVVIRPGRPLGFVARASVYF